MVEDSVIYASLFELTVTRDYAFTFTLARTLKEGLACLQQGQYDCTFLDLHLPDSIGVDTVKQVRALTSKPIIVITGATISRDLRQTAEAYGADAVIQKGADAETVLTLAEKLIEWKSGMSSLR